MMLKTHIAIAVFFILIFFLHVSNKLLFPLVVLIVTAIPDIDTGFSTLGKYKPFKPIQFFTKHRSLMHSFTLCIFVTLVLSLFLPVIAFPFFLAYSLHILTDSYTIDGIKPFWPSKKVISWKIKTGSTADSALFFSFVLVDLLVFIFIIKSIF